MRLFEAAACGRPIVSDRWQGLGTIFEIGEEILAADSADEVVEILKMPEDEQEQIGLKARRRILAEHTAEHRAGELEGYARELLKG